MAEDFGTPLPPLEAPPQKKSNTTLIIVIVVLVLLCCCCLVVGGGGAFLWNFGDQIIQSTGIRLPYLLS